MTAAAAHTPTQARTVPGYRFQLSCPCCAGAIVPVASGTSTGREARAVAVCLACRVQLLIVTTITVEPGRHRLPIEVGAGRPAQPLGLPVAVDDRIPPGMIALAPPPEVDRS